MSCARAIAAVFAAMMLAGCVSIAPGNNRPAAASFDMLGRVLVSGDGRAFSSGLRWRHDAAGDELWLMSPVGQTLAHIAADETGAVLTTPDQQEYRAFSAENLTRRALGWPLPLTELRFWIVATPAGGDTQALTTRDAAGRLSLLEQNGWIVRYTYPESPDSTMLPKRLDMSRGDQRIRLVIDGWRREEAP
ncbi:MAG: outer-rane lipoprotein LolB [Pseudomonadota bacterium]|jgi:outer membrane lipoprotein LolB